MQIKTIMSYHLIPAEWISSINQQTSVGEDVEKWKTHVLLMGMQTDTTTVESSMELPQIIKNGTALQCSNSTSRNLSEKPETLTQKNIYILMFLQRYLQ